MLSFTVKPAIKRFIDKASTITAVSLSCNGEYIAVGYDAGFVEVCSLLHSALRVVE